MKLTIEELWKCITITSALLITIVFLTSCATVKTQGKKTSKGGWSFSQTAKTSVGGKQIKPENVGTFSITTTYHLDGTKTVQVELKSGVTAEGQEGGDPASIIDSATGLIREISSAVKPIPVIPSTKPQPTLPSLPEIIEEVLSNVPPTP